MAEVVEPGVLQPTQKRRQKIRLVDIVVFGVLLVVIVALLITLLSKLGLKHEVSAARPVADRLVQDIATKNASDARALGDGGFQAKNSETTLRALFASADQVAKGSPTLDRQTVSNSATADTVYFIYKYAGSGSKNPYYIRVTVTQDGPGRSWRLTGITGDANEASLTVK